MARLTLLLMGEGEAFGQGERLPGTVAVERAGPAPHMCAAATRERIERGDPATGTIKTGAGVQAARDVIRRHVARLDADRPLYPVARLDADRPLYPGHNTMAALVRSGDTLGAVEAVVGPLG